MNPAPGGRLSNVSPVRKVWVTFLISRKKGCCRRPRVPTTVLSFGSGPLFSETLSYLSSRRTRISYFTALASDRSLKRPHAVDRSRNSQQEIRGSRGTCRRPSRASHAPGSHKLVILRACDFLSMERLMAPAPQPPCPSATVLSLQPPSPICHPDRRGGTCSSLHQQPIPAGSAALPIVILSEAPRRSVA